MRDEKIITIKEVKTDILDMLEYASDDGITIGGSLPSMLTMGMKPCVADKLFDTEDEAVEYEFNIDERFSKIKHLSGEDKVIEFYDEDDELNFEPFVK